jgi:hypothetical protein
MNQHREGANAENTMSETATATEVTNATEPAHPFLRSIKDIVKDLEKPVADRHLSSRKQGGTTLQYIAWYNAERYLDLYAPGWTKEIREIHNIAGKVAMTIRITVPAIEGDIHREATGYEDEVTNSFGDPFSNAESMALRRAAANFGLGRYLYDKN